MTALFGVVHDHSPYVLANIQKDGVLRLQTDLPPAGASRILITVDTGLKWWKIQSDAEAQHAGKEIADALAQHGLPALTNVDSIARLRDVWATGKAPGLTERLQRDYLKASSDPAPSCNGG